MRRRWGWGRRRRLGRGGGVGEGEEEELRGMMSTELPLWCLRSPAR